MSKEKRSFFERLTGVVRMDNDEEETSVVGKNLLVQDDLDRDEDEDEETEQEGELTVDVYQTADTVVIKAMIAGVRPEDLDISITRDLVTIRGKREEERTITEEDFIMKELYWGSFSRAIALPVEIDVDEAEAIEKHGLLILKLPKLDKKKKSKLKVRTG
jgi:HSP20 family protein